jgi:hypothetical protein
MVKISALIITYNLSKFRTGKYQKPKLYLKLDKEKN